MSIRLGEQGFDNNVTTSCHNIRIERPWLDAGVKVAHARVAAAARAAASPLAFVPARQVVGPSTKAVQSGLEKAGLLDLTRVHDRYALRVAVFYFVSHGIREFGNRYNMHNVQGPRGGVPRDRAIHRNRPPGAPPPNVFDETRDWPAEYAAETGNAWHARDHFIEVYCGEILRQLAGVPGVPSPEDTWKDVKCHEGLRGELQTVFQHARRISQSLATADSLERTEETERIARGGRSVSED